MANSRSLPTVCCVREYVCRLLRGERQKVTSELTTSSDQIASSVSGPGVATLRTPNRWSLPSSSCRQLASGWPRLGRGQTCYKKYRTTTNLHIYVCVSISGRLTDPTYLLASPIALLASRPGFDIRSCYCHVCIRVPTTRAISLLFARPRIHHSAPLGPRLCIHCAP